MKARVLIHRQTGELDGATIVGYDADIRHIRPTETHAVIALPVDHPAIHDQSGWRAEWTGKKWELRRKTERELQQQMRVTR